MPTFSIVIPTYNSELFIERTIRSVLDQTYKDFEIVIVDDGSSDSTVGIINKIIGNDSRVKLITTLNSGGPTVPMNMGITESKGAYIAFLDHDDEWHKNKLEVLNELFSINPEIGFIGTNVEVFNVESKTITQSKAPIIDSKLQIHDILSGNYFNTFSMLTVRRAILEKLGVLDTQLFVFADFDIIIRMAINNVPYLFLKDALTRYYVHKNNASGLNKSAQRRIRDLEMILEKYSSSYKSDKKSLSKILHAIARLYLYLGNKDSAVLYFKKSIACDPFNPTRYIRLLSTYFGERFYKSMNHFKSKLLRKI